MKSFRIVLAITFMLMLGAGYLHAQFGRRLGEAVGRAAERTVTRKAEDATEKAVDAALDPDTYGNDESGGEQSGSGSQQSGSSSGNQQSGSSSGNQQSGPSGGNQQSGSSGGSQQTAAAAPANAAVALEMAYAKSDFVPGDEIFFEDLLIGEKLGEFPSMWDLRMGNAEVASVGGENAIHLETETLIIPLMKEKNYLPDVFTIEFDLYVPVYETQQGGRDKVGSNSRYNIDLIDAADKTVFQMYWYNHNNTPERPSSISWNWLNGGENLRGEASHSFNLSNFNHIAISFNKRALKLYIDGIRVVNIPRADAPTRFQIFSYSGFSAENRFIKNVRMAKGAVPLYDRMMSDGKIISYGITFDVGKSTIKPESMGEINRIATLMKENPELKFSVEGHTDSTGNAASNQTLSDARSKAVVEKLVETGIAASRLTSSGKGQNSPIADNGTDEGRAKNRRVEFVKVN